MASGSTNNKFQIDRHTLFLPWNCWCFIWEAYEPLTWGRIFCAYRKLCFQIVAVDYQIKTYTNMYTLFITIPSVFLRWNQCHFGFVCVIWCSKQERIGLFVCIFELPWLLVGSRNSYWEIIVQFKSRDNLISHSMSKVENKIKMVSFLEMAVSNRMYAMCIFHRKIGKCLLYKCRQINVVIMKLKHYTLYNTSSISVRFSGMKWLKSGVSLPRLVYHFRSI